MKYDPLTRILHLLVAAGVTAQLLNSLVMIHPKPGRLPNVWYEVHEGVGLAVLAVVMAYWLWVAVRSVAQGEAPMLFPWFSRRRLAELADDVRATGRELRRCRLPAETQSRPLPAAIQGIGLLLALFLAASGAVLAVGAAPTGGWPPAVRMVKEAHEAVAPLMWAYLAVHPLLGVLHQLAGHRSLSRMFGPG
ncbi:cytochrome b/b6 domain-containing protein [Magnetospirillum sp. SS-4]|uniref:cytochrome b/b6 domain-containing protein n=1 Tax=Magnetospirillum sp. SS-4 TaxID=2681465 RepID=UPI0013851EE5|nr:cytochrome b/b6 domain-containing protein [Magnetospirillum sp. SS-4]CAA7626827.1 conserved membrane hypothetical protein [Magnetospirillum sp. SS-4]